MKKLFENWQIFVEDESEDQERNPKVVCRCLCTDCAFNKNKRCVAETIDLQFAQKEDGSTICECVTYKPGVNAAQPSNATFNRARATAIDES